VVPLAQEAKVAVVKAAAAVLLEASEMLGFRLVEPERLLLALVRVVWVLAALAVPWVKVARVDLVVVVPKAWAEKQVCLAWAVCLAWVACLVARRVLAPTTAEPSL
jgi:hypothetical protein